MFAQIRLAVSMRQNAQWATRIFKCHDFLFVVEDECSRPGARFQIEMHAQETGFDGCQRVPSAAAGVRPEQASRRFGDLIDDGIFRHAPQKPQPLQRPQPCPNPFTRLCDSYLLGLQAPAIAAQVDKVRQQVLRGQ